VRREEEEEEVNLPITGLSSSWWLEAQPWFRSKLGELVPYFEYFNLVTQSMIGIWVSGGSDLRAVLLVRTAAVST
jgi:hypothetical protein